MPAAVIAVVPLAALGVVATLLMRGADNNVYTQIGIVLLVALASKNAILIVEFASEKRREGLSIQEAATRGGLPAVSSDLDDGVFVDPGVHAAVGRRGSRSGQSSSRRQCGRRRHGRRDGVFPVICASVFCRFLPAGRMGFRDK